MAAIVAGLAAGGRGQLRAACGTGKTKIALWSAERLVDDGNVVVISVPTVGLVGQTLREWAAVHPDHTALAVCSDHTVAEDLPTTADAATDPGEGDEVGLGDILEPVTTDPDVVAAWLTRPTTAALRLIVGTHRSTHVIGEGLQKTDTEAELLIVDEAHRTAGAADKRSALIHDDEILPARRRLYMTATPRMFSSVASQEAVSMDDERVFGPVLYNYPFSQAIKDGYLDDYRLLVVGVTKAEVLAVLQAAAQRLTPGAGLPSEHTAMVQAAIARAAVRYNLRRVLTFCPRVADAKDFADSFTDTVSCLPSHSRPALPLHAKHVSGYMKHKTRQAILDTLAMPPDDGWTVVSNARCLSEGIDVPAVDAVAFTAPKESPVDIVQAIGRALRCVPGKGAGVATILVPVLLDAHDPHGGGVDLDRVDAGSFSLLLQVALGLRSHDDQFAAALSPVRAARFFRGATLDKTQILTPAGVDSAELLQHLTVHLVRSSNSPWWEGFHELVKFAEREGHANPKSTYKAPSGYPLGQWLATAAADYRGNRLSQDRIDALADLGAVFDRRHLAAWDRQYEQAAAFYREHGHLRVPSRNQQRLYSWLAHQRRRHRDGTIRADHLAALDKIGMEWDPPDERVDQRSGYDKRVDALRRLGEFVAEHGMLPYGTEVPRRFRNMMSLFRAAYRDGDLEPEFIRQLEAWGIRWTGRPRPVNGPTRSQPLSEEVLDEGLARLRIFHRERGHADVDRNVVVDGFDLGTWAMCVRAEHGHNGLRPEVVDELRGMGFSLGKHRDNWERVYLLAEKYVAEYGNLAMSRTTVIDEVNVGEWLRRQRRLAAAGTLSPERRTLLTALDPNWMRAASPGRQRVTTPRTTNREWLARLRAFRAEHDRLPLADEGDLGAKLAQLREQHRAGELSDHLVTALTRLGAVRGTGLDPWDRGIVAATGFFRHHGHLDTRHTLPDYHDRVDPDFDLDKWLNGLRKQLHQGKLTREQITELESLGMVWLVRPSRRVR